MFLKWHKTLTYYLFTTKQNQYNRLPTQAHLQNRFIINYPVWLSLRNVHGLQGNSQEELQWKKLHACARPPRSPISWCWSASHSAGTLHRTVTMTLNDSIWMSERRTATEASWRRLIATSLCGEQCSGWPVQTHLCHSTHQLVPCPLGPQEQATGATFPSNPPCSSCPQLTEQQSQTF